VLALERLRQMRSLRHDDLRYGTRRAEANIGKFSLI